MLKDNLPYRIILASNSPRRRELLSGLDIDYEIKILPDIDESYPSSLWKEKIPVYISQQKAAAYSSYLEDDTMLITADTIVWMNGQVYGKPKSEEEAVAMLQTLSGKMHEVITGVTLTTKKKQKSFFAVSKVKFAVLDEDEIRYYIRKYKPYDKAGSYGVQEWIGYIGVERLEGSFYNVMGLPVRMLYHFLKNWNTE